MCLYWLPNTGLYAPSAQTQRALQWQLLASHLLTPSTAGVDVTIYACYTNWLMLYIYLSAFICQGGLRVLLLCSSGLCVLENILYFSEISVELRGQHYLNN